MNEEKSVKSPLQNRKISIYPINRQGDWGPINRDSRTKGLQLPGSQYKIRGLLYNESTRRFIDPLIQEEKDWLYSQESGMNIAMGELNPHKKPNFWTSFQIVLHPEPLVLDLNDVMDWLRFYYRRRIKLRKIIVK
jgi:hypothetical protein